MSFLGLSLLLANVISLSSGVSREYLRDLRPLRRVCKRPFGPQKVTLKRSVCSINVHHGSGAPVPVGVPTGEEAREQRVTPWDVSGAVDSEGRQQAVDYDKLINQFGTEHITKELLERFERLTRCRPHRFLRRGVFFSHRELDQILDRYEQKKPFFLYTGRGPSSPAMHLGHMVPFIFCKWLQDIFDCPLVIQLTDDEKFIFKTENTLEQCQEWTRANARDIIAVGFNPKKTFIFNNLDYVGGPLYHNIVRISKYITTSTTKSVFGFQDSDSIGKFHFVSVQAAPSFSNSFPHIYGSRSDIPCLIPCAIDQDPYFRLTSQVARRLGYPRPRLIFSKFFPALQGSQTKMSASNSNSAIFMDDTPNTIKKKINKYAFSGGGCDIEKHRRDGGNTELDVAYHYISFFLEDDDEVERLGEVYRRGELLSSEMKRRCIEVLQEFIADFQKRKAAVTDEFMRQFMDASKPMDVGPLGPLEPNEHLLNAMADASS